MPDYLIGVLIITIVFILVVLIVWINDIKKKKTKTTPESKTSLPKVQVGMSVEQVIRLLGNPDSRASTGEMRAVFNLKHRSGAMADNLEYWVFNRPWGKYQLMIRDGRIVEKIHSQPGE